MRMLQALWVSTALTLATSACTADTDPGATGPRVAITVAPLQLPGVTNAEWQLTVLNSDLEQVASVQIDADGYGDGAGSISYVAPCDADSNDNRVELTLLALYQSSGAIDPATYRNPGTLSQLVTCSANEDTQVTFDVAIVRDASQGFFDVAVSFDDLFCSAKLDCRDDEGAPIQLLHQGGERDDTVVLGLACTGGAAGSDTRLYLDDIVVTCPGNGTAVVDPSGGPGNLGPPALQAGGVLFGAAVFSGEEQLGYDKLFWNVALGFEATFPSCRLTARGTASDGPLAGGATPADTTYPYILWDVALTDASGTLACSQHPISGTPPGLAITYAPPSAPVTFAHSYAGVTCPNASNTSCGCPTPTNCVALNQTCDASDPLAPVCADQRRVVFVSRFLTNGTMGAGGLASADAACQAWADNAAHMVSVVGPGAVFKAWLSDDTASPSTRFVHDGGPFVTVNTSMNATIIANDWADLTDGTLDNAITTTEEGLNAIGTNQAWTATAPDGTPSGTNCSGWTTTSGTGQPGDLFTTGATWSQAAAQQGCSGGRRLYCFQQAPTGG